MRTKTYSKRQASKIIGRAMRMHDDRHEGKVINLTPRERRARCAWATMMQLLGEAKNINALLTCLAARRVSGRKVAEYAKRVRG